MTQARDEEYEQGSQIALMIADATAPLRAEVAALRLDNQRLLKSLKDLYSYQQSISSPDTRWGLPVYRKAREAIDGR